MSDSRILSIRKSDSKDPSELMFPIMFIGENYGYPLRGIIRKIYSSPEIHIGVYPEIFPHTIAEYFWIKTGIPGSTPWIGLGKLTSGSYFLYTAYMIKPSDTFVNNGQMNLWISIRYRDIIQFAMDMSMYDEYILATK